MKKLKWILVGVASTGLVIAALVFGFFKWNTHTKLDPFNLIPSSAMYIFESDEPLENWDRLQENSLWKFLSPHPSFKSIKDDADYMDSLIQDNKTFLKAFGNTHFITSAHPIGNADYDFLIAFDLKGVSKISSGDLLANSLEEVGFNVDARIYEDFKILTCKDPGSMDILYMCQVENYLICSYTSKIVEASINAYLQSSFADETNFQKTYRKLKHKGYGNLYVRWENMDKLVNVYSGQPSEWLNSIFAGQSYASFDMYLEDRAVSIQGYSHAFDSTLNYLNALRLSGGGSSKSADHLSNRTAIAWTMCFASVSDFYSNLKQVMSQNEEELAQFEARMKKVEGYLEIDLENDILSWMGSEISIAQNKKFGVHQSDEYVALIKLSDRDKAAEKMNYLNAQIKRKTPAKFKKLQFKAYTIHYLELKGMFSLLFGDLFEHIEKPYYTFMGDYLVMSNSAVGLIGLIDDFENKRVLSSDKNYQELGNHDVLLNLYVAPFNTYEAIKPTLRPKQQLALQKSKSYFEGLGSFSLNLSTHSELLSIKAALSLAQEEKPSQLSWTEMERIWKEGTEDGQTAEQPKAIRIIEDGYFKQFYPASEQLHIEAKTKWGIMHGKYTEYHQNGEVKCTGKFRKGQKTGVWKYYDEQGELSQKLRF